MLDGYHRIFNAHALKEVMRTADIPQPALGIGFAERLDSVPLLIRYEPATSASPLKRSIKTLEDSSVKGQGQQISASAFPMTGYLGEMLGGF